MILTDKESKALVWWIQWTVEYMEHTVAYSKEMEQSGEVEKGYHQRATECFNTVLHLEKKLKS